MSIPQNDWLEAQVAVLGSVLLDEQYAGLVVSRTSPEQWCDAYRPIFEVIRAKYAAGETIDPVTVRAALGPEAGGLLMQIMQVTPTAANCAEYLDLMLEQHRLLRLREVGEQLATATTPEAALTLLEQANALTVKREKVRVVSMDEALRGFFERQQSKAVDYLKWGIDALDERLYCEGGDFVILGGYPSDGKTALALSMAYQQGKTHRVGFFSYETKDAKLFDRLIPTLTRIDFGRVKKHTLTDGDWDTVARRQREISANHLELIPANGMTVADLRSLVQSRRYEILYIDYLQLVRPSDPRRSSFEQVTQISMDLHTLAQGTGTTVVALSQLSRPEKQGKEARTKAPGMHSLRQSGQIEQDADIIMFIYREEPNLPRSRRCLKVAKNKEGEAGGVIMLAFDGGTQTFRVDRNDPSLWRAAPAKVPEPQMTLQELSPAEPVPFEKGAGA